MPVSAKTTSDLWWKNAIMYCVDVKAFQDSGYDVSDYYNVDPRLGTLGDVVEFLRTARDRGIKVITDLVVNHTSDEHPWFRAARSSRDNPYRDFYVWRDEPDPEPKGIVFPGEEDSNWQLDERTGQYYLHRFYKFQPDLNVENPAVWSTATSSTCSSTSSSTSGSTSRSSAATPSGRRSSSRSPPTRTCGSTTAASGGGSRPWSTGTSAASSSPTACCSPSRGRPSCSTARRSAWATTSPSPAGPACAPRCSGRRRSRTAASRPPTRRRTGPRSSAAARSAGGGATSPTSAATPARCSTAWPG